MSDILYKKPLQFSQIFAARHLDRTTLGTSISQHLELIIFTRFGEHRSREDFGCGMWELDFELIVNKNTWEEKFRTSLLDAIRNFEQRLYDVEVQIEITEVEKLSPVTVEIKKQAEIYVEARMSITDERYVFNTTIFLSPLSV